MLTAFGLKTVIAHTDEHLDWVTAFALLGGIALYLLGLVAFRYRQKRDLEPLQTRLRGGCCWC